MTSWPSWHLQDEPAGLAKYVLPEEVSHRLRLPGPSEVAPIHRVRQAYEALRAASIQYAFEHNEIGVGWQTIRSPRQVLEAPGHGTCLDVTLILAGALIVAGLRSMPVVLVRSDGQARHVVLVVDLLQEWKLPLAGGVHRIPPVDLLTELVRNPDTPIRRYCAIDAVACTSRHGVAPEGFATALDRGAEYLTSGEWQWEVGVDLRMLWEPSNTLRPEPEGPQPAHGGVHRAWHFGGGQGWVHFARSARGQRVLDIDRTLFHGRTEALRAVSEFALSEGDSRKPLVIVGPPGAGKSCVIGRAVEDLADSPHLGLAFHCADSTSYDLRVHLGKTLGCEPSLDAIHECLARWHGRHLIIAVDSPDESRTEEDRESIVRALQQISVYSSVRVIVATRTSEHAEEALALGSVATGLHDGRVDQTLLCRLDSPDYFSRSDLITIVDQTLRTRPTFAPRDAAWCAYKQDPQVSGRLAEVIAERVGTNYYLATMVATRLAGESVARDPSEAGFDVEVIAEDVGHLVDDVLGQFGSQGPRFGVLMSALAYGRGSGLSDNRWLEFAHALGLRDAGQDDLSGIRNGPLSPFLSQKVKGGVILTRFFHASVRESFKARRNARDDERALCRLLRANLQKPNEAVDPYACRFLPSHVLGAELGTPFLSDAEFLAKCDPSAVAPLARHAALVDRSPEGALYLMALTSLSDSPGRNAQALVMAAMMTGKPKLADELTRYADWDGLACSGGVSRPSRPPMDVVAGHTGEITALVTVRMAGHGGDLLVSASRDGSVRVWDPFGAGLTAVTTVSAGGAPVIALTCWQESGEAKVAFADEGGRLALWSSTECTTLDMLRPTTTGVNVTSLESIALPGVGRCLVCGTSSGEIIVLQATQPGKLVVRFHVHEGAVLGLATVSWPARGGVLIATSGADGAVQIWDLLDQSAGPLLRHHHHTDWAGDVVHHRVVGGRDVLVSVAGDSTAVSVAFDTEVPSLKLVYSEHRGRIRQVGSIDYPDGSPAIVTSSDDGTARIWAIEDEEPRTLAEFDGPAAGVRCTVQAHAGTKSLFVSGCRDGRIYLWHPTLWDQPTDGERLRDLHTGRVRCSTTVAFTGHRRALLITGSNDCTARVWASEDGAFRCVGVHAGHTDWVRDVLALDWPGQSNQVVASASGDGTVKIWNPLDPSRLLCDYPNHAGHVRSVRQCRWPGVPVPVLLSAADDGTIRVWNPYAQPGPDLVVLKQTGEVRCAIQVDGDRDYRLLSTCDDQLWIWEPEPEGGLAPRTLLRAGAELRDIAVLRDESGSTWVATAGNDNSIYATCLDKGGQVLHGFGHNDWVWGLAAASAGNANRLLSVSADGTLRVWVIGDSENLLEKSCISLLSTGMSIRTTGASAVVTTAKGFYNFTLGG